MITTFSDQLIEAKRHRFNISHQYSHYRSLHQQMNDNECLIHTDFSETMLPNMPVPSALPTMELQNTKLHSILASTTYIGTSAKANPFCSLSDSLKHGPGAIWAHLDPVIDDIKVLHPIVDTMHFYSTDRRGTSTSSLQSSMKRDSNMQLGISVKLGMEKVHLMALALH